MGGVNRNAQSLNKIYRFGCRLLDRYGIPFIPFFGTLLGIVRENNFIECDDDVDFLVPAEYSRKVLSMVRSLGIRAEFFNSQFVQLYTKDGDGPLDLYFFHKIGKDDVVIPWEGNMLYSFSDIYPLKKIVFHGRPVRMPAHPHRVLRSTYGNNYLTPIKANSLSEKRAKWGHLWRYL